MCGVIGLINKNYKKEFPTELLRRMANEAQIRGQHATGIATIDDFMHLNSLKLSLPATMFPIEEMIEENTRAAIVHCRYSTSDLAFNQPMVSDESSSIKYALIHNGVVSQADPSTWLETYGVECTTRNDSEILLRMFEKFEHPLKLENTSQACIVLDTFNCKIAWWRNEQRPLYYVNAEDYIAIASTKDILLRSGAGTEFYIKQCDPCVSYLVCIAEGPPLSLRSLHVRLPLDDLQKEPL